MRLDLWIEHNKKDRKLPYNFFIIQQFDLDGQALIDWAEHVTNKHKVIVYRLSNNELAIYRFSYPNKGYLIPLYFKGKKWKLRSRSKEVIQWWLDYHYKINPFSTVVIKNKKCASATCPSVFRLFSGSAKLLVAQDVILTPTEALNKYWSFSEKEQLVPASGEKKTSRTKRLCLEEAAKRVIVAKNFYGEAYKDITLGDIDHLALLRYKANPVKNKDKPGFYPPHGRGLSTNRIIGETQF